jgi:NAD(P)-dependent dehydrogenase (short-subunit alcohol dehydrogenase family)
MEVAMNKTTVSHKWELHHLDGDKARALRPEALFDLTGKVAIVTGAGGGIGSWLSAGLAAAGANVLLTDHPKASMTATSDAIKAAGGRCEEFSIDLLAPDAVDAIVEAARASFGRLDILVNNAGVNRRERIFDVSRESWDLISTIDLRIPFELSRAAARVMAEGDGGSIIQMGSLNNAIGLAGVSVYGASKAALCQLAKSMSVEWAQYKIRVNAICPGFVLTPLTTSVWADPVREKWLIERTLWERPSYPDDLVGLCLLLASNAGCFITGQAMYVDGGWLAGTPWDKS